MWEIGGKVKRRRRQTKATFLLHAQKVKALFQTGDRKKLPRLKKK